MIDTFDRNPNLKVSLAGSTGTDTGSNAGQNADAAPASGSSTDAARSAGAQTSAGAANSVSMTNPPNNVAAVNVRLAVDGVSTLDPGSLGLFVDDVKIDVPADGFVELTLDPGQDHAVVATARRGGQVVRAELHEKVTIDDEDKALSLQL
jgi:hypothetical protein